MKSCFYFKWFGEGRQFLSFGDAADVDGRTAHKVNGLFKNHGQNFIFAAHDLPNCNWCCACLANKTHGLEIFWPNWIFEKEEFELFQIFRQPSSFIWRQATVCIMRQLDIPAHLFPEISK